MSRSNNKPSLLTESPVLFDPRFVEAYAGEQLLRNPITAIVELIANAWDAGATKVQINWSHTNDKSPVFSIEDNGHGMTDAQFQKRWRTLAYNHVAEDGEFALFPADVKLPPRRVFGRNGVGRFASFYFGRQYTVRSWRDGHYIEYIVSRGIEVPLTLRLASEGEAKGHGTIISIKNPSAPRISDNYLKSEIGMRFLVDPCFKVYLNEDEITFQDIPSTCLHTQTLDAGDAGQIIITVIDTKKADTTTKLHGVAWRVNGKLVGECSWKGSGQEALLDGRLVPGL